MKYKQQKTRINLGYGYTERQRKLIMNDVIEYIKLRTKSFNVDKKNDDFSPYSEEYAAKKGQTEVDLTLSGDMLDNLQGLKDSRTYIEIGYDKDYSGMGKVEGNRLGTYGNDKPVTKGRDFLGIDRKTFNELISKYKVNERERALQESIDEDLKQLTNEDLNRIERDLFFSKLGI